MADDRSAPVAPPPDPAAVERERIRDQTWARLRQFTAARIGLARSGASLATKPMLDLRLAHARARDAVHAPLDEARLLAEIGTLGLPVLAVSSAAGDRRSYLARPDLGRRLSAPAEQALSAHARHGFDVAFVITDGLSAQAVQRHARPLLAASLPALQAAGWTIAPLVVVRLGRVAVGDGVAVVLGANAVVTLIGERPGLSAPDSMGAYLTWQPGAQTSDADRNCLSNIRPEGIGFPDAAAKLVYLLNEMRRRKISGVQLKDDSDRPKLSTS